MVGVLIDALGLGLGLSMDAAAVSMTNGMSEPGMRRGKAVLIAAFYGVFQGLMPLIGYLAGSLFTDVLSGITPYLALVILGFLGGKTLYEGIRHRNDPPEPRELGLKLLTVQAFATSIDALAVGVTFAFLETPILSAVSLIGVITFCISVAGVAVGCWFGVRYKQRAEITGGVILVLLGTKILLEHLGLLSF